MSAPKKRMMLWTMMNISDWWIEENNKCDSLRVPSEGSLQAKEEWPYLILMTRTMQGSHLSFLAKKGQIRQGVILQWWLPKNHKKNYLMSFGKSKYLRWEQRYLQKETMSFKLFHFLTISMISRWTSKDATGRRAFSKSTIIPQSSSKCTSKRKCKSWKGNQ